MQPGQLLKQAEKLLELAQQERQQVDTRGRVVIYDPVTRQPLPGHEPNPQAEVNIWIPDDKR